MLSQHGQGDAQVLASLAAGSSQGDGQNKNDGDGGVFLLISYTYWAGQSSGFPIWTKKSFYFIIGLERFRRVFFLLLGSRCFLFSLGDCNSQAGYNRFLEYCNQNRDRLRDRLRRLLAGSYLPTRLPPEQETE